MKKELTKGDVYVVVDTPKKAKKLKKVLDMFGERTYSKQSIDDALEMGWIIEFDNEDYEWLNNAEENAEKSEVSIKELRNILAVEHLKEGDVIIAGIGDVRYVVEFKRVIENKAFLEASKYLCIDDDGFTHNIQKSGNFHDFIRYATEAEKELLRVNSLKEQAKEVIEPVKKELDVCKWYKGTVDFESLIFITEIENTGSYNRIHGYGFMHGYWNYLGHLLSNTDHEKSLIEATHEEVEKALIEEAKRRYKVGNKVHRSWFPHRDVFIDNNTYNFNYGEAWLTMGGWEIFSNGQWATIIEQPTDKFAELKEAHSNGKKIQCRLTYLPNDSGWLTEDYPTWDDSFEYRIKPEEKPKVGDLVKAWDNDERDFVIGKLNDIDDSIYPFTVGSRGFKNAKKITPQEAKELLTDYCR